MCFFLKLSNSISVRRWECNLLIPKSWRSPTTFDFGSGELNIPKRSRLESPGTCHTATKVGVAQLLPVDRRRCCSPPAGPNPRQPQTPNGWGLVGWKGIDPFYPAMILLLEEILHQLICSLSYYLQGFIHPRWCRISSINSRYTGIPASSSYVL